MVDGDESDASSDGMPEIDVKCGGTCTKQTIVVSGLSKYTHCYTAQKKKVITIDEKPQLRSISTWATSSGYRLGV